MGTTVADAQGPLPRASVLLYNSCSRGALSLSSVYASSRRCGAVRTTQRLNATRVTYPPSGLFRFRVTAQHVATVSSAAAPRTVSLVVSGRLNLAARTAHGSYRFKLGTCDSGPITWSGKVQRLV